MTTDANQEHPTKSLIEAPVPSGQSIRRTVLSATMVVSGVALLVLVLFIGPFAWLLRDGLGPDSIDSVGWNAIARMFWCFYWGPATIVASSVLIMAVSLRKRLIASLR